MNSHVAALLVALCALLGAATAGRGGHMKAMKECGTKCDVTKEDMKGLRKAEKAEDITEKQLCALKCFHERQNWTDAECNVASDAEKRISDGIDAKCEKVATDNDETVSQEEGGESNSEGEGEGGERRRRDSESGEKGKGRRKRMCEAENKEKLKTSLIECSKQAKQSSEGTYDTPELKCKNVHFTISKCLKGVFHHKRGGRGKGQH